MEVDWEARAGDPADVILDIAARARRGPDRGRQQGNDRRAPLPPGRRARQGLPSRALQRDDRAHGLGRSGCASARSPDRHHAPLQSNEGIVIDVREPRRDRPELAGRAAERRRARPRRRRLGRRPPGLEPRRPTSTRTAWCSPRAPTTCAPPSTSRASAGSGWRPSPPGTPRAGIASLEDTILLRTLQMAGVEVDAGARRARVEAGALWGDVGAQAAEHGLAGVHGSAGRGGRGGLHARRRTRLAQPHARARREQRASPSTWSPPTASSCAPTATASPTCSGRCAAAAAASAW